LPSLAALLFACGASAPKGGVTSEAALRDEHGTDPHAADAERRANGSKDSASRVRGKDGPTGADPAPRRGRPVVDDESTASGDGRVELDFDFPPTTRSLRVRGVAHVMAAPEDGARYIGKITRGTRVRWQRIVGPDEDTRSEGRKRRSKPCEAWAEIEPRGYLCTTFLEPSDEAPGGERHPILRSGALTPEDYYRVLENGTPAYKDVDDLVADTVAKELTTKVMVVGYGVTSVDDVPYRRTDHGLVLASSLARFSPSSFEGRPLVGRSDLTWPFAWAVTSGQRAVVREAPEGKAQIRRRLAHREVVPVLEERDGYVRVDDVGWVDARSLRIAELRRPPEGIARGEQWIDVDLEQQVLVAYEGALPVFATLVSTGAGRNSTPLAHYRVRAKAATTPMAGDPRSPNRYEVSGVPWALRLGDGLYIHGVYWHDGFGVPRSHGCINLAPRDAAYLYEWVEPRVPIGWSEVEVPAGEGVQVRVRSGDGPEPPPFDYRADEPWNYPPPPGGSGPG
jgi:hypothetical protein